MQPLPCKCFKNMWLNVSGTAVTKNSMEVTKVFYSAGFLGVASAFSVSIVGCVMVFHFCSSLHLKE